MISLDQARAILLDEAIALPFEKIAIGDGLGRTLAQPVIAARDQPPAAMSAMDGFAVRDGEARIGATLRIIGEAPAGAPFGAAVGAGEAVRIATGAVVPEGAGRIVIQEHVERRADHIRICKTSEASFVRPVGGDFAIGQSLVEAGQSLTPARIGLIAAAGFGEICVARKPRVAILPSGDELREPGGSVDFGSLYNSAAYAVAALIEQWGGIAIRQSPLPDDSDALATELSRRDLSADVVVPLGGASVGDRDRLRPAFEQLGAHILFDRVAVIPGKPCWHARFPDDRKIVGLPGNPASAFVCACLLIKPLVYALTGRDAQTAVRLLPAIAAASIPANGNREAFLRGRVEASADGRLMATFDPRQDSSLQTPLADSGALIRRKPGASAAAPGDVVEALILETL